MSPRIKASGNTRLRFKRSWLAASTSLASTTHTTTPILPEAVFMRTRDYYLTVKGSKSSDLLLSLDQFRSNCRPESSLLLAARTPIHSCSLWTRSFLCWMLKSSLWAREIEQGVGVSSSFKSIEGCLVGLTCAGHPPRDMEPFLSHRTAVVTSEFMWIAKHSTSAVVERDASSHAKAIGLYWISGTWLSRHQRDFSVTRTWAFVLFPHSKDLPCIGLLSSLIKRIETVRIALHAVDAPNVARFFLSYQSFSWLQGNLHFTPCIRSLVTYSITSYYAYSTRGNHFVSTLSVFK